MDTASDGKLTETPDVPLETKMESLGINEASCSKIPAPESPRRRSLRKRIPPNNKIEGKRRVTIKPKKRLNIESTSNSLDINQIYLCKKIKKQSPTLETIFEEPKISKTNEVLYMGLQKKKRFLVFEQSNQGKIKKRHLKSTKAFGKTAYKKTRSSIDTLLHKLNKIE